MPFFLLDKSTFWLYNRHILRFMKVTMNINCPHCDREFDVSDDLPQNACDDTEIDCDCGAILLIGWYAEAEVRRVDLSHIKKE